MKSVTTPAGEKYLALEAYELNSFEYNPGRNIKSASFYAQEIPEDETAYTLTFEIKDGLLGGESVPEVVELSVNISQDKFSWSENTDGVDLSPSVLLLREDGTYPFKPGETVYLSDILDNPAEAVLAIKAIN